MNSNLTSVQNSWLKNFFEINSFGEIIGSDQLRIESSQRKFFRIKSSKNSLILMIVPPGIEESVSSFVTKGNYFHKYDVNVPQIYASDEDLGLILVEDFGDKIYQFNIEEAPDKFYELAINELIKIQSIDKNNMLFKKLDFEIFEMNWNLFEKYFFDNFLGMSDRKLLNQIKEGYKFVCNQLSLQPEVICHYDFECRNLIYTKDKKAGILDFQDAVIGPIGLDLASLFKDLYYDWPEEKIVDWYSEYNEKLKRILNIELNLESLVKFIDFASIQRQVRILGKLSQVYEQLNRLERLKDFHKLINYLKNTSEKYSELENFSRSIAILQEPLKIKLEKIFS